MLFSDAANDFCNTLAANTHKHDKENDDASHHLPPPGSQPLAYLALFVALGGTAVAAKPLITGADVADDSLTGADIAESSLGRVPDAGLLEGLAASAFVRRSDTAGGDLTGPLGSLQLVARAVTGDDIAFSTITGANIAGHSLTMEDIEVSQAFLPAFDLPPIPAASCLDQLFYADTHVLGGMLVLASPRSDVTAPFIVRPSRSSANGEARAAVCNPTASAIDPAPADFVVNVLQPS